MNTLTLVEETLTANNLSPEQKLANIYIDVQQAMQKQGLTPEPGQGLARLLDEMTTEQLLLLGTLLDKAGSFANQAMLIKAISDMAQLRLAVSLKNGDLSPIQHVTDWYMVNGSAGQHRVVLGANVRGAELEDVIGQLRKLADHLESHQEQVASKIPQLEKKGGDVSRFRISSK